MRVREQICKLTLVWNNHIEKPSELPECIIQFCKAWQTIEKHFGPTIEEFKKAIKSVNQPIYFLSNRWCQIRY